MLTSDKLFKFVEDNSGVHIDEDGDVVSTMFEADIPALASVIEHAVKLVEIETNADLNREAMKDHKATQQAALDARTPSSFPGPVGVPN